MDRSVDPCQIGILKAYPPVTQDMINAKTESLQ